MVLSTKFVIKIQKKIEKIQIKTNTEETLSEYFIVVKKIKVSDRNKQKLEK